MTAPFIPSPALTAYSHVQAQPEQERDLWVKSFSQYGDAVVYLRELVEQHLLARYGRDGHRDAIVSWHGIEYGMLATIAHPDRTQYHVVLNFEALNAYIMPPVPEF